MSEVFRLTKGTLPLLISVPHDGRQIPAEIRARMTDVGQAIPDTDWHVERLYDFTTSLGASKVVAKFSRYVVDLNRASSDESLYPGQVATGLCPLQTFAGEDIYREGGVDAAEQQQRVADYWLPYHQKIRDELDALRNEHGYALLWDAHSIPSCVPRLFDGELPELNLGSNRTASCTADIETAVATAAAASDYSAVVNGRFQGGYITRHYGEPDKHVHALQLEIAQRAYMDEASGEYDVAKAAALRDTLTILLESFLKAAHR